MKTFLFTLLIAGFVALAGTGCDRQMTKSMMDSVAPTVPTVTPSMSETEAFRTPLLVEAGIELYQTEGIEAAIDYYNDPANIDGLSSVFIADENDRLVAYSARPDFVGTELSEVMGGLGAEIAKTTEIGFMNEYVLPNQATGEYQQVNVWSIRHDGYLFGTVSLAPVSEGPDLVIDGVVIPPSNIPPSN